MYTDATTAAPDGTKCEKCRKTYISYRVVMTWTWINDCGPYCEECMRNGVTYRHPFSLVLEQSTLNN
jgi:hypothetical protein